MIKLVSVSRAAAIILILLVPILALACFINPTPIPSPDPVSPTPGPTLEPLPSQSPAPYGHAIGINFFASQVDYAEDRLFADAMKTSRDWLGISYGGDGEVIPLDAQGWPLGDSSVIVWHGIANMHGSYYLEGECAVNPTISAGFAGGSIQNQQFADGRFSATLVVGDPGNGGLLLSFQNTAGGVRRVKLMRPLSPGSNESYPTTASFTQQAKDLVAPFSVVRFMWLIDAWNGAWQVEWADRVQADVASYQRGDNIPGLTGWAGKGAPWEVAVQFCNETGKDMWLNMPLGASDDYIRQLATLIRNSYRVEGGKIYWEYSNEATWDMVGMTSSYLRAQALAEADADGPVGYDGMDDANVLPARYYAKRAA